MLKIENLFSMPPWRRTGSMFTMVKKCCRTYSVSALKKSVRLVEQLLYPLKCLKCGAYIDPDSVDPCSLEACFCDHCMAAGFTPMEIPFCPKCSAKFHQGFEENHLCEACLKTPLNLDRVRAVAEYKGIIKEGIQLFKYHSKLAAAKVFERLLFQAFLDYYATARIDLILPIPLHRKKLRQRGFNQAYMVIRNFVNLYQQNFGHLPLWRIDMASLVRFKLTQSQTGFDMDQRKRNLKNAFKVVFPKTIDKKHILLIDDVFTTGATCNEAAKELLRNGAGKVDALVLART